MSKETIQHILAKYIPESAVETCSQWIVQHNIHVRITRSRSSKYGDYRPMKNNGHQITINHDLNPYAFLITFVHEVAHMHAETRYRGRISPHGKEWKSVFSLLLGDFVQRDIFPTDLLRALTAYMQNPAASSCSDLDLLRALRKYDKKELMEVQHLEDLPSGTLFRLHSSRSKLVFKKGKKIRTRFHCMEMTTKREYFVNPLTEVIVHEIPQEGLQLKVLGV
ncbi:MAG: sprT domain-containing protein [Bacteroidetes bacterium]|nr:sprT domain-containing protein [Bacteroidota bacterium]